MLVNFDCSSWYNRVGDFSVSIWDRRNSDCTPTDQHAWPNKTTPLLWSAWSMALSAMTIESEWFIYLFNHHSTQCHWPRALEWGCSTSPCMLIHWCANFLFSYHKLILKIVLTYCRSGNCRMSSFRVRNVPAFNFRHVTKTKKLNVHEKILGCLIFTT